MSEPSKEALAFVARWACNYCSESLGPDDEMPECEYCTDHRRRHAQMLDAFAAPYKAQLAKAVAVLEQVRTSSDLDDAIFFADSALGKLRGKDGV